MPIKEQRRKNTIKEEIEKITFKINKTKESKHTDINKEKIKQEIEREIEVKVKVKIKIEWEIEGIEKEYEKCHW